MCLKNHVKIDRTLKDGGIVMKDYHAYPVDKYKKCLRIMLKPLFFTALFFPTLAMAQSYIVYDFTNNRMLETHQPNSVQPIASVTKLMTAIVFLEHNRNARQRHAHDLTQRHSHRLS